MNITYDIEGYITGFVSSGSTFPVENELYCRSFSGPNCADFLVLGDAYTGSLVYSGDAVHYEIHFDDFSITDGYINYHDAGYIIDEVPLPNEDGPLLGIETLEFLLSTDRLWIRDLWFVEDTFWDGTGSIIASLNLTEQVVPEPEWVFLLGLALLWGFCRARLNVSA